MSSLRYLCIIPARGGSKGIPQKNLRLVGSQPMIAWSIRHALETPEVDRTLVSTDSTDIATAAADAGAEVPFLRPAALARDDSPTEPSLLHALEWLHRKDGYRPDAVVLLQATAPIRPPGTLSRAIRQFESEGADSLVSAREIHPFLWRRGSDGHAHAEYDYRNRPRRQDIPEDRRIYEENGSLYITRTDLLEETGNRLGRRISLFVMGANESVDIDNEADLGLVDALLRIANAPREQ